jgi:hypothetical protein
MPKGNLSIQYLVFKDSFLLFLAHSLIECIRLSMTFTHDLTITRKNNRQNLFLYGKKNLISLI